MDAPLLTVGMPTYHDYDGVFFTIQSLRMHHPEVMDRTELVVINNNPNGKETGPLKQLMQQSGGRYIAEGNWKGPWVKDLVFREAKGKYVVCMDCHILLELGVLQRLLDFYQILDSGSRDPNGPSNRDLFQGPLVYDDLKNISTHFEPTWRGEMWGIWATNPAGKDRNAAPFEIPMQGMGLFSSSKQAWEEVGGFNRLFKGFGGEEGYIHEKFRQAGRRCWCLPFLRWMHRFNRPFGVPFELIWENKVWNYGIGHTELGLDVQKIIDHFVSCGKPKDNVEKIINSARNAQLKAAGVLQKTAVPAGFGEMNELLGGAGI